MKKKNFAHCRDVLKYLDEIKDLPKADLSARKRKPASTLSKDDRTAQKPAAGKLPVYTDIPMTLELQEAANEMVRSKKEIPHLYFTADCRLPSWLHGQGIYASCECLFHRNRTINCDSFFACETTVLCTVLRTDDHMCYFAWHCFVVFHSIQQFLQPN